MHYLDYNEQKQHGTPDFPMEFYHVNENHPRYNMPFHWHKELEIIRILEGRFLLKLDDEEFTACPGDIFFVNEGVTHGGVPENCIYECIVFDMNALLMHTDTCRRYLRLISMHQIYIESYLSEASRRVLSSPIDKLFRSMGEMNAGSELMAIGTLYQVFGLIFSNKLYQEASGSTKSSSQKMAQLKPVLKYIETSYTSPITLSDLSKIAGMSPKYFCRYFNSIIHRTPMDYLNYYRIERASYALSTTECSVTDVAYSCGFNDISYFIKTFKKYKGVTPKRYEMIKQ